MLVGVHLLGRVAETGADLLLGVAAVGARHVTHHLAQAAGARPCSGTVGEGPQEAVG